jgi:transcriptional regulator with XRE-family HTH domain
MLVLLGGTLANSCVWEAMSVSEEWNNMLNKTFSFAHLLKQWRLQRGLSPSQLAQAASISRVYLHQLEIGMRTNPSEQVVRHLAHALLLPESDRQQFFAAFRQLTGREILTEMRELPTGQVLSLADLLVQNSTYPAHALDQLWYIQSWNEAALDLFEIPPEQQRGESLHLFELIFGAPRPRFLLWESLARRLITDFLYATRALTHLPAYQDLWQRLSAFPDFQRLAVTSVPCLSPSPFLVVSLRHRRLGLLTLRTVPTVFTRVNSSCIVSYLPENQHTLSAYHRCRWQAAGGTEYRGRNHEPLEMIAKP